MPKQCSQTYAATAHDHRYCQLDAGHDGEHIADGFRWSSPPNTPRAALLAEITEAIAWSQSWSRDEFAMQNARTLHYDMAGKFEPLLERAAAALREEGLYAHCDGLCEQREAELTALRQDRERLDWLESEAKRGKTYQLQWYNRQKSAWDEPIQYDVPAGYYYNDDDGGPFPTLRAALDAARQAGVERER